jgi:potassium efflux system protein
MEERASMITSCRLAKFVAFAALVTTTNALTATGPQQLFIGPAAPTAVAPVEPAKPPAPLAEKRTQNAEQLRLAQRKIATNGTSDKAATQEVAFYQRREAVLAQQEAVEKQINDLKARKTSLEAQLKNPPASDKPPMFADFDRLKDLLAADQARVALLADRLASAKVNEERAERICNENEVKSRHAQAASDNGKETQNAAALAAAADAVRHEAGLAAEIVTLRKSEIIREQLSQEVQQVNLKLHQDQLARMTPLVTFSEKDYQAQIDEINSNQEAATNALSRAQESLRGTELELNDTKKLLDAAAGADRALLTEKAAAQWRTKQRLIEESDSNSQRLQQLSQLQAAWDLRYELASGKWDLSNHDDWLRLKDKQKETERVLDELESGLRIQILTMKELRNQLTLVVKKADAAAKGPADVLFWIQLQQTQLEETLRIYDQRLVTIESARRLHEKLLDELNASLQKTTPMTVALGAWHKFKSVWDHPLTTIGDKVVTYGMAIQSLATLIIGWVVSRFASAVVAYRLLKRFRLSKDATSAIRSLVYYSMLFGVVLEAMKMVNVDLTALSILGGALAIGVGFGSQALINNFTGGLIMLAERPVRLGERITFGGMDGIVEDVGFRCTKLRTNADHLVTIPNSTLVNESIENIDRRRTIRRKLNIPVTYNVSRETLAKTVQVIRDVLEEKGIRERIHPIIGFEEFLPRVFFSEFAAESLNIQVVYWYAPVDWWAYMEHSEKVNFRIMEEFERLGIEFAFPSKTTYVKNAKKLPPAVGREPGSFAA